MQLLFLYFVWMYFFCERVTYLHCTNAWVGFPLHVYVCVYVFVTSLGMCASMQVYVHMCNHSSLHAWLSLTQPPAHSSSPVNPLYQVLSGKCLKPSVYQVATSSSSSYKVMSTVTRTTVTSGNPEFRQNSAEIRRMGQYMQHHRHKQYVCHISLSRAWYTYK